jgi:hypothetical protein
MAGTRFLCAVAHRQHIPPRISWDASQRTRADPLLETHTEENIVNRIIYIVGAIVIVLFILGFFGLR